VPGACGGFIETKRVNASNPVVDPLLGFEDSVEKYSKMVAKREKQDDNDCIVNRLHG
jgi:hypothetical protein